MIILLDIDGVVADLVGHLCALTRCDNILICPDDVRTYDFASSLPSEVARSWHHRMSTDGFALDLPWYPGAQDFVKKLSTLGEVIAVTKPYHGSRTWAHDRSEWLKGHVDKVIHTGHKEHVRGDVLIEDSDQNLLKWTRANAGGVGVRIPRPWNADWPLSHDQERVWAEALRLVKSK